MRCTGDYFDVWVMYVDVRRMPWSEVSNFDNDSMRGLMRQVVNGRYGFHVKF